MAKKEISGYIKLQINGGQANPAPPVGPALGQRGINIMEFCKAFNEKTKSFAGKPVPVIITVYKDKKFDFIIKSPPASHFIKEAVKLKSGSKEPGRNIVAKISKKQLKEIAQKKMSDLNAHDVDEAAKIIAGFTIINPPAEATAFTIKITQGSTAFSVGIDTFTNNAVGSGATVYWPGGNVPIVTQVAGKTDIFSFKSFDACIALFGIVGGQNFSN